MEGFIIHGYVASSVKNSQHAIVLFASNGMNYGVGKLNEIKEEYHPIMVFH